MPLLKDFKYHAPTTLTQVRTLLRVSKDPLLLAGGTFVLNYLKKAPRTPSDVIGLKKIAALRGIRSSGSGLSIGAMTTIAELMDSALIRKHFPSLFQACSRLATTPVRNMATIGGNLCSRFFWVDLPSVLISLGSEVSVIAPKGKATMGIEELLRHKKARKLLVAAILLPKKNLEAHYFRHTKTTIEVDAPSLSLAFACSRAGSKLKDVRLIVNTASSFPVGLIETQKLFEGREAREIDPSRLKACLGTDVAQTKLDEYRIHCLQADLESITKSL